MAFPAVRFDNRTFGNPAVRRAWTVGRWGLLGLILAGMGMGRLNAWSSDLPRDPAGLRQVAAQEPYATATALRLGGAAALAENGLTSLERRLFSDAADGRLDEFSLLTASLVASGVESPEVLGQYQKRLDALAAELERSDPSTDDGRKNVEAIFGFLHRRILHGGYRIDCTDLRVALDEGGFNCVSASVLFQYLAERRGLDACGLEMPGHAMSRVRLPNGPLDVETTCSAWFRLMDDPKRQAQSVRDTLGTLPDSARMPNREVCGIGLVAMVYYNRGVDLLAAARYAEAASANAKALTLDPDSQTARGNLLATVNNWAIALGQSGRLDEAISILEAGMAIDPQYEPFALNYAHVCHQRGQQQASEGLSREEPASGAPPVLATP